MRDGDGMVECELELRSAGREAGTCRKICKCHILRHRVG